MASFRVDGLDELLRDFSAIAELPDTVAEDMLNAEADVLVEAAKGHGGEYAGRAIQQGHHGIWPDKRQGADEQRREGSAHHVQRNDY